MGYINPLPELMAGRELQALSAADQQLPACVLRTQAVATQARYTAHALKR